MGDDVGLGCGHDRGGGVEKTDAHWGYFLKICHQSPGKMAHLVGASSCAPKDCGFDLQSGHINLCPELWRFNLQSGPVQDATDRYFFFPI